MEVAVFLDYKLTRYKGKGFLGDIPPDYAFDM
jgi:hypothetical protein